MVNKVTLVGYLGRDPQLRRLESGAAIASFSVATNERYQTTEGEWREQTEWHEVTLWRKLAERAEQALRKGMLVYLEGKLNTRSWQDREGVDRTRTEVVANYLRILDRGEGGSRASVSAGTGNSGGDAPAAAGGTATGDAAAGDAGPEEAGPGISVGSGPSAANDSDESGLPF